MKTAWSGVMTGALLGFIARGAVVVINMEAGGLLVLLALPSAVIGALVGGIAGASGKPLKGAVVGAVLSGLVFEIIMMGFGGFFGKAQESILMTIVVALQMAVAGAIAGGLGGLVGSQELRTMASDRDDSQSLRLGQDPNYQQVAGSACTQCKERVSSTLDGAMCPGCGQALHYRCGVSADKTQAAFLCGACRMNASP